MTANTSSDRQKVGIRFRQVWRATVHPLRAFVFVGPETHMSAGVPLSSRLSSHLVIRLFHGLRAALCCAVLILLATVPAAADVSDALKAVGRDGHARVIMRMRTAQAGGAQAGGTQARTWAAGDSAARQAQAVDAAVDDAAGAFKAARVENYHRFRTLPYVAADP